MSTIKRITLEEIKKLPPLTKEEIERMEKAPIVYDEDCRKLTKEELAEFRPWYELKHYKLVRKKESITIRLDSDILDFLKQQGKGYQTRINNILRWSINNANCPFIK